MTDTLVSGSCHCGAVKFRYQGSPEKLVDCNCSICRRLRALWLHGSSEITIEADPAALIAYTWGDMLLAFQTCRTCGCTTHWMSLGGESPKRAAVNAALADPQVIADIPIRRFDGADTWRFFD